MLLFMVYAACFGIELTVLRFAVGYFTTKFDVEQGMAGFIVLCFSLCNLFARSLGGLVADLASKFAKESLPGRVYSLFIILFVESIFLILFSLGDEVVGNLGYTITMMIMFSLCVQAAEGATFAIVPFVQPKAIGPVAGIVGAGGNLGAMIFAFAIFINVPDTVSYMIAWLILGIFVFCVSWSVLCIRFSIEEIRAADEKMNTWNEIEKASGSGSALKTSRDNKGKFESVPTDDTNVNAGDTNVEMN
jgi:NNP family nitrate/nitrite transporter-like MFS transporter